MQYVLLFVLLFVVVSVMYWSGFAFGFWVALSRKKPTHTCSCHTASRIARIPLRVVFYRGGVDGWTAHCLEFDMPGSGVTREDALEQLTEIIATQLDYCLQQKDPSIFTLFSPASGELFEMFARGRDVVVDNLEICLGRLAGVANEIVVREFTDEMYFNRELVPFNSP